MQGNGKNSDLLDRAMRDLTPEQRARTLDLVLRLGIDRDDPLFLVTLAIGQLQTLVQDAPEEWRKSFESFSQFLESWTQTNLQMFAAVTKQAEATETVGQVSKELITSLTALTRVLTAQSQTPQTSAPDWQNLERKLNDWQSVTQHRLTSIEASLKNQKSAGNMRNISTGWNGDRIERWSVNGLLLVLLVMSGGGWLVLWQGQQQNSQRLQW
ncbi:hypothetical protein HW132_33755, partial [Brasilonema sp. CT11]|nr:hypothetical protein [Brasilonema sp. CT11]